MDPDYVKSYIKNAFSADAAEKIVSVLDSIYVKDESIEDKKILSRLRRKIHLLLYFDIKKRWGKRVVGKLKRTFQ